MSAQDPRYVYGPVPSRRLGRSLGVDLVPFKVCTYDCVYCQLGRTTKKTVARQEYVAGDPLLVELGRRLDSDPLPPDYISISGSGEPTLNSEIGRVIRGIKEMTDIPVAVLTNGSLLSLKEVQDALMETDLVLPSLDAGDARLFRRVNRPHRDLSFETMFAGLVSFSERYPGAIWLEVLLLAGVTGTPAEAEKIAVLAERIGPARVQLNTVCRPPAEPSARPLALDELQALAGLFPGKVDIIGPAPQEQAAHPEPLETRRKEVLGLLRRRPCTAKDVADGLSIHMNEAVKELGALTKAGTITTSSIDGRLFYTAARETDDPRADAPGFGQSRDMHS
jgi:wyosine [tRNA(Phe)-imidazoG37] synthetase (radical SAM superfamily)